MRHEIVVEHESFPNNLVDPASSHMLVSQIKPCMSKCKYFTVKLRMAHYNSYCLLGASTADIRGNPTVNTCHSLGGVAYYCELSANSLRHP